MTTHDLAQVKGRLVDDGRLGTPVPACHHLQTQYTWSLFETVCFCHTMCAACALQALPVGTHNFVIVQLRALRSSLQMLEIWEFPKT